MISFASAAHFIYVELPENQIAAHIVQAAINIHRQFGPGLLENAYEALLFEELHQRGLFSERQKAIPLYYGAVELDTAYRADLFVGDRVIVEVKSIETLTMLHRRQLLTYLRLADKRLGLLINFNVLNLRDGLRRVVNGLPE